MLNSRKTLTTIILLNLSYFGCELMVAHHIGSVSLFADCVDFLEDASINVLILVGLGWGPIMRARLGHLLALILLAPGCATVWAAWTKFHAPLPPNPTLLSLTAAGALLINLACALLLFRMRNQGGSLTRAAFLSARNDAAANLGMITAGVLTAYTQSGWPDLAVGAIIAAMNADAAFEVWEKASEEARPVSETSSLSELPPR